MKTTLLNLFKIIIWFSLFFAMNYVYLNTSISQTHYQPTDTPHERFRVLVIHESGNLHPVPFATAQTLPPSAWQRELPNPACHQDCLRAGKNGSLIYNDEGAGWFSDSEYRIENNRLIPVSYRWYSMMEMFYLMILSAVLVAVVPYFWRCWQYRHSKEQLMTYHRAVGRKLMRLGFWGLAVILLYAMTNWAQAA